MLEIPHIDRDGLRPAEAEQRHHKQTADINMPQRVECQPSCTLCRRVAEPIGHKSVARLMKRDAQQRRGDEHCRLPYAVKLELLQPCYKSVQIKSPVCRSWVHTSSICFAAVSGVFFSASNWNTRTKPVFVPRRTTEIRVSKLCTGTYWTSTIRPSAS